MFINTMKVTKKDGTLSWKIQICESIRNGKKITRKVIRHVGIAHREEELERFQRLAASIMESEIAEKNKAQLLFEAPEKVEEYLQLKEKPFLSTEVVEESRTIEGPQEVYGTIFDNLGLGDIISVSYAEVLKNVVIARILEPSSKRHTQEILSKDLGFTVSLDRIYRMMTNLSSKEDEVIKAVFSQTSSLFNNKLDVVFFDVTTLYFESTCADELKEFGYSKDQKFHSVQVVLALATTQEGLPVGYKLFPGNTAETKTLLSCLDEWKKCIDIGRVVFVADRAMFSAANLFELQKSGYEFIVAAKLKSMTKAIKEKILSEVNYTCCVLSTDKNLTWSKEMPHTVIYRHKSVDGKWEEEAIIGRLICTYNSGRAQKDKGDRQKILDKMQKILNGKGDVGKLVSNSGYKKYAQCEGKKLASIDNKKVETEEEWDGMHGIFTNTPLSRKEVLEKYRGLWSIEESFRINKHDLSMRPIFHYTPKRIRAHIAICFLAFTLIRHLQYKLKTQDVSLSPAKIIDELKRVQSSRIFDRVSGKRYKLPSKISEISQKIYSALNLKRNMTLLKL